MSDAFVLGSPLGRWQTNCYAVGDRTTGRAVLVDPGETAETQAREMLDIVEASCEAILLTHGHLDHLWAVPQLARALDVPVLLHADDRWLWDDPAAAFGAPPELLEEQFGLTWDPPTEHLRTVTHDERLHLAGITFDVHHNPGHTPGHVTYLGRELLGASVTFPLGEATEASQDVLFSGDLVFAGSIGRTDFPRGSVEDMFASLVATVLPLEDDTLILSGHGPDTHVGVERESNPFLRQAMDAHGHP
ncbi:MAG: MBL fold metallo-hydrolase [Nitriliruptoraceae bacterium]|nr:MBL fold metallo-hydrolase [Nitriliruptoraceae bacterium]